MALAIDFIKGPDERIDSAAFQRRYDAAFRNIAQVVVASEGTIRLALLGLFSNGHVLLEDRPSVGKTLLAKTLAQSIEGDFTRIQFTPDLLPTDIIGCSVFNPKDNRFDFVHGPVFTNILLADELNRANPRTQSALLEAMAEGQVTGDGISRTPPSPFLVIATQNSLDSSGIFPLPDTELDRFLIRISIGMPSPKDELEILCCPESATPVVQPVLDCAQVHVAIPVKEYVIELAGFIRNHPNGRRGISQSGVLSRASYDG